jgi:hypothetical protein
MGLVSSAVAAMDAHQGVATVVDNGVMLLANLAEAETNKVCCCCCRCK